MNKSDSIGSLAAALSKAQSEFPAIPKDKEVTVKSDKGSYKFKYAPLESITSAIRPVLAANGLAFTQSVSGDALTTTIIHASGEWMQSDPIPVKVASGSAQALGSGITYARRYSLCCSFGIVADEDDDANGADGNMATIADAAKKELSPVRPNASGEDFWNNADADEKRYLNECLGTIRDHINNKAEHKAGAFFYRNMTNELEQAAVWSQLSKEEKKKVAPYKPQPEMKEAA